MVPWGLDVTWEPNAAEAVLANDDSGTVVLALKPRTDDPDDRCVVLRWRGAEWHSWGAPNDEAIAGHPFWAHGLRDVRWGGVGRCGTPPARACATRRGRR